MPNDQGLRRCRCGNVYLLQELHRISQVEHSDAPHTERVPAPMLPQAIAQARTPAIELAARLEYWHHLNHDYRERYRAHREAEESATQQAWQAVQPDTRRWWQRWHKAATPPYQRPANAPFTVPPFRPTPEQRDNMTALLPLLQTPSTSRIDHLLVAELHRELGEFDLAAQTLQAIDPAEQDFTSQLLAKLIQEHETAPMRYRL